MKKTLLALLTLLAFTFNLYAENMEMVDTDGKSYKVVGTNNEIKIEGMEEKVVFLEFFGLKCPGCKKIMPNLINVQEKYKEKLQIMAIEVQKNDVDPINAYKQEHGINYITLSNYDVGRVVRYVMEKSGWKGAIPFVVAIDSKGQVQFAQAGVISEEDLAKYVEDFSK
jgi:thiol-disulfide isomerase/thioredoxin